MRAKLLSRLGLALVLAAAGLGSLPAALGAPAAPGDLDLTFGGYGTGGLVLGDLFPGTFILDTLALPDGQVIAAGSDGSDFIVVRSSADGQIDPSFGAGGVARLDFAGQNDIAYALALAPDDKILVVGITSASFTASDFAVARLLADGTPDTSFSLDGKQTVDFNGMRDSARMVLAYSRIFFTGTIVVGGSAEEDPPPGGCVLFCKTNLAMARLNDDGSLDTGFNGTGKAQANLDASEVALAGVGDGNGTGEVLVVGNRTGPVTEHVVVQWTGSGSLAATFGGGDGVFTGTVPSTLVDVGVAGGQFVAVGAAGGDFGMVGFDGNGNLANDFGTNGVQVTNLGGVDLAQALRSLSDGTFVVAGASGARLALAHFTGEGQLIPEDVALTDLAGATTVRAHAVAIVPDLRLWTIGSFNAGSDRRLAFTRRFLDFSLDAGGRQATDFGNTSTYPQNNADRGRAAVFQSDGKLLAAGSTTPVNIPSTAALARYNTNGTPDLTFGDGGRLILTAPAKALDVAYHSADKIVVAGDLFDVARLNADGSPDLTFNLTGYASANWANTESFAMALQPDGKPILAGVYNGTGLASIALARFDASGALDETFGTDGLVRTGMALLAGAYDVTLQPNGKVIVAGVTSASQTDPVAYDFAVLRYNQDGSLDSTFGGDGKVSTDFGSFDNASAVVLQPDGKIVVAGVSYNQGMAFARYLSDGTLDATFASAGKLLLQFVNNDVVEDLAADGAGLVAVACDPSAEAGLVVRLTAAGALDMRFNGNGRARFEFHDEQCPMAVATNAERFAAVGWARGLSEDFALAVYTNLETFRVFMPIVRR